MARRPSKKAAASRPLPPPATDGAVPVALTSSGLSFLGGNGYQGADWSNKRGYVYFPQLDTRREIDSYSRTELLRRARFLYANIGFVRRIINGMSRMVIGTGLIPQAALADDPEWCVLANNCFARRAESAAVWDIGGRYDFYSSQLAKVRLGFKDGDVLEVLTESDSARARFALYEGHQIRNANRDVNQDLWNDGVRTDRYNRAVQYRIVGDNEQFTDVSVDDAIYWGDYERNGQNRCQTILYHAVNNLLDVTEILSALKHGVKISSQIGYYLAAKDPNVAPGVEQVFGTQRTRTEGTGSSATKVEDVYSSGRIPDIGYRELKTLLDERPHPNSMGLLDYLARDISWGAGLSSDILWNIASLGGANSRFILADAQGFIEEKQDVFSRRVVKREWNYTIAKEIKTGNLREPRINGRAAPGAWLDQVTIIPPKRVTVDFGRDGKLMLEQLARGALTHDRWFAMNGQDARDETMKELQFRAWRRDEARKLGFESDPLDEVVAGGNATDPAPADPSE